MKITDHIMWVLLMVGAVISLLTKEDFQALTLTGIAYLVRRER